MKVNPKLKNHLTHLGNLGFFTTYRTMPFFSLLEYTGFGGFEKSRGNKLSKVSGFKKECLIDWLQIKINNKKLVFDEWGNILECSLEEKDQESVINALKNLEEHMIKSLFRTYFFNSTMGQESSLQDYLNLNVCPTVVEFYNFIQQDLKKVEEFIKKAKITQTKLKFFKKEHEIGVEVAKDFIKLSAGNAFIKIPLVKFEREYFTSTYKLRCMVLSIYNTFKDKWDDAPGFIKFTSDPLKVGISMIFFSEYYDKKKRETATGKSLMKDADRTAPLKQKITPIKYGGDEELCFSLASRIFCALGSYIAKNGRDILVIKD